MEMKQKKFAIVMFILALAIGGFGFSIAETEHGFLKVSTGGGVFAGCQEDWSSSFWDETTCEENNQKTFICIQTNPLCDTENLRPKNCDPPFNTRSCGELPPNGNGGNGGNGGGGGGNGNGGNGGGGSVITISSNNEPGISTACVESWSCSKWSNVEGQCGTRTCEDQNACGTETLKPATFKECESSVTDSITGAFLSGINNFIKSPARSFGLIIIILAIILIWNYFSKSKGKVPKQIIVNNKVVPIK